ncbi:hypothetical protein L284_14430 [Novosphingobium lindaniclasticum LE124]|uniref:Uncharacterized protein n=1 Tax=Novosphingobium lindaniclasticum LE124 TaxID=1096930 RepID=T0INT6_9SPHN|nr:hypothetical protein L284_14430 [Novosphingobium lindaniclasticum LE124]
MDDLRRLDSTGEALKLDLPGIRISCVPLKHRIDSPIYAR